jgi:hypothetical protein
VIQNGMRKLASDVRGTVNKLIKFAATGRGVDSIATDTGTAIGVAGDLSATGNVNWRTAQGGAWRDQLSQLTPPNSGLSIPVLTAFGTFWRGPAWALNDQLWTSWHINHDYKLGTAIHFHMHWFADGTNTAVVKWEWTFAHARGHNQEAFPLGGAGTVVTAQEAAQGTQYRHMITESVAVVVPDLEPDSMILARIRRVTNGGVDNVNLICGTQSDIHYQADTPGTKNRTPNFYT